MKKILFTFLVLFSMFFSACEEQSTFESEGLITGYDLSMCACCGGYIIVIDGETYRIWEFIDEANFVFDDLPQPINLNWSFRVPSCASDYIVVESYELN